MSQHQSPPPDDDDGNDISVLMGPTGAAVRLISNEGYESLLNTTTTTTTASSSSTAAASATADDQLPPQFLKRSKKPFDQKGVVPDPYSTTATDFQRITDDEYTIAEELKDNPIDGVAVVTSVDREKGEYSMNYAGMGLGDIHPDEWKLNRTRIEEALQTIHRNLDARGYSIRDNTLRNYSYSVRNNPPVTYIDLGGLIPTKVDLNTQQQQRDMVLDKLRTQFSTASATRRIAGTREHYGKWWYICQETQNESNEEAQSKKQRRK